MDQARSRLHQLQAEYRTTLRLYDDAMQTFRDETDQFWKKPCSMYRYQENPRSVSQACYAKIWSAQRCDRPAPAVDATKGMVQLMEEAYNVSKDATRRGDCYTHTAFNASMAMNSDIYDSRFLTLPMDASFALGPDSTLVRATSAAECAKACDVSGQCAVYAYDGSLRQCRLGKQESVELGEHHRHVLMMVDESQDQGGSKTVGFVRPYGDLVKARALNRRLQTLIAQIDALEQSILSQYGSWSRSDEVAEVRAQYADRKQRLETESRKLQALTNRMQDMEQSSAAQVHTIDRLRGWYLFWSVGVVACLVLLAYMSVTGTGSTTTTPPAATVSPLEYTSPLSMPSTMSDISPPVDEVEVMGGRRQRRTVPFHSRFSPTTFWALITLSAAVLLGSTTWSIRAR